MFDLLRDLRKTEEEKRQEALSAYLDDALTPVEKERFERLLAEDEALRANLEEQRLIRASLRRLPRMRAPRNFTLDPAVYGRPVASAAERLYPIMRAATAMVALLFALVLVLQLGPFGAADQEASAPIAEQLRAQPAVAEEVAGEEAVLALEAETAPVEEAAVEVTRLVEDEAQAAEAQAAEEPAEAAAEMPAEEMAEEEAELPSPEEVMGGGGPAEEAPLAAEAPPGGEGLAGAPETEMAEDEIDQGRAANESTSPLAATVMAELPTIAAEATLTKEATGEAAVGRATFAIPAPAEDGGLDGDSAPEDTSGAQAGAGPSATQILAILLGAVLVVLAAVTLLLRQQTR